MVKNGKINNTTVENEQENLKQDKKYFKKSVKSFLTLTGFSVGLILAGFIYTYIASKQIDKKYNMED